MTRTEFLEDVNSWWELIEFCSNEGCDTCEDIYSEDSRDEYINEQLMAWAREDTWQELYSRLENIPTGYDYYRDDGYGEWVGMDDGDFDEYKDDVLEWMDNHGYWDEEDDDEDVDIFAEELEREKAEAEEAPVEEEAFSIGELMDMCSIALVSIQKENVLRTQEANENFSNFVRMNTPKTLK